MFVKGIVYVGIEGWIQHIDLWEVLVVQLIHCFKLSIRERLSFTHLILLAFPRRLVIVFATLPQAIKTKRSNNNNSSTARTSLDWVLPLIMLKSREILVFECFSTFNPVLFDNKFTAELRALSYVEGSIAFIEFIDRSRYVRFPWGWWCLLD